MSKTANPFSMFETDEKLEAEGIVIDYGQFWIKVGAMDRPDTPFVAAMTEAMRPYTRAIQLGQMDNKIAERILRQNFAEHLTLGWGSTAHGDGLMVGKQGEAIEFTVDNVVDTYAKLPRLFMDLVQQAKDFTNFRKAETEIDAGN